MSSAGNNSNENLRRAEERFRLMVESSPVALVICNRRGRIELVNRQTENWFGYDRKELLGQEVEILVPERFHSMHAADRERYLAAPTERPMGAERELFARRKDGSEFPVDISLHPMETESGLLVLAHIVDLTDRKRAEIETERRHAVERLALLGQLAGGVAHEIRNPLGVIRNAAYYLQMVADTLDRDARESVAEIQEAVTTANHIVGDLLDYARDLRQQPQSIDVAEHLRQLIHREYASCGVAIDLDTPEETVRVLADPDHVDRIMLNLIRNAVQASPPDGRIRVRVKADAGRVMIDVTDDGVGVAPENRSRVFEPLFTTKARGIGLGLAVSRRYAERNDGTLELIERPGRGSTFRLTLPLAGLT